MYNVGRELKCFMNEKENCDLSPALFICQYLLLFNSEFESSGQLYIWQTFLKD